MTTKNPLPTRSSQRVALSPSPIRLQRKCDCGQHTASSEQCEECKKKKQGLQRYSNESSGRATAPVIVHEVLRSPGQPLNAETLRFMGARFHGDFSRVPLQSQTHLTVNSPRDSYEQEADRAADHVVGEKSSAPGPIRDFGQVRVHVGPEAAESARQVSALAYTVGSHIVFGDGQYAPSSGNGRRLLAHELAHVIQQRGSEIGQALQTQVLQRDDDESGDDQGKEKKPKSPFDPPDQLGKCGVDILHPEKFVNCCTEAIGDGEICTDQVRKFIDSLRKRPCPEPAKRPDGTCCPLPMIWDGLKGRCSKTITALGNSPIKLCEPGEKPTVEGGCRKADDKPDQSGHPGQTQTPVPPSPPPDAPVRSPQGTGKTAAPPSGKSILHFNLDKPAAGTSGTESNLVQSLTPAGKSEWTGLVAQLKANPAWKFQLVGKASPEGPATYNLDLGKRRAQLVAKALMENGIDRSRIVDVAPECKGVEAGIYTCGETDAAGPEDRQVKFVFAGASGATP